MSTLYRKKCNECGKEVAMLNTSVGWRCCESDAIIGVRVSEAESAGVRTTRGWTNFGKPIQVIKSTSERAEGVGSGPVYCYVPHKCSGDLF